MPVVWGPRRGSWNVQVGLEYSGIEVEAGGARARLKGLKYVKRSLANVVDTSNSTSVTGDNTIPGGIPDNLSFNGSGTKTLYTIGNGSWINLSYTVQVLAAGRISTSPVEAGDGSQTVYVEWSIKLPLRPVGLPSAPTGLTVSGTGSDRTLTWTNTTPTDPAKPYTGISVRRRVNGGEWAVIANPGVVTTFTNSGLGENVQVEYQVAGRNSAGTGPWSVASAPSWTTPRTPTIGSAEKNSAGAILVSATNQAPYATLLRYQDSPDGVAWADVGTLAVTGLGVKTWPHASPNPSVTHRYQVRAERGALVSGWSGTSNIVALQAKPNPPTILGPSAAADPADDILLSYRHNPVDTTPQTQREVRYAISTDGGGTWPGWTSFGPESTDVQQRNVPGGTLTDGLLRWQVRTRGAHPDWSDWSASSTITLTGRPVAGILQPTTLEHSSTIQGVVSYSDPNGLAQSNTWMTVTIPGSGVVLDSVQAFGTDTLPPFTVRFQNGITYHFTARVTNAAGLTSDPVTVATVIEYLPPEEPDATITWDRNRAAVTFETVNPPGTDREPLTGRNIALFGDSIIEGMGFTTSWEATVGTVCARQTLAEPRRMWIAPTTDGQCIYATTDRDDPQDWTFNGVAWSYFVPGGETVEFGLPAGASRARVWVRRTDGNTWHGAAVTAIPQIGAPVVLDGPQTDPSGFMAERIEVNNPGEFLTVSYAQKGEILGVEVWEGDTAGTSAGVFAFGVTGQNSAEWATSVHMWKAYRTLLSDGLNIDTVLIAIMTNDKIQNVPIPTYTANITNGINMLKDFLPGAEYVGVMMPNIGYHDLTGYNAALAGLVDSTIDCTSMILDGTTVGHDGTHLLDEGNRQLAALLRDGLNPPAGGSTTNTDHQQLWRINPDGTETLVADQIPPDAVVSDPTPYTIGGDYRLVAVSAEGSTTERILEVAPDPVVARSWWLNAADLVAPVRYNVRRQRSAELAQVGEHYAGRPDEVVTYGEAVSRSLDLDGILLLSGDPDWSMLEAIATTPEPAVVRGPDGTWQRVRVTGTTAQDSGPRHQDVAVNLVPVGNDQPPVPIPLGG